MPKNELGVCVCGVLAGGQTKNTNENKNNSVISKHVSYIQTRNEQCFWMNSKRWIQKMWTDSTTIQ